MTKTNSTEPDNLLDKYKSLPDKQRKQILAIVAIAGATLAGIAGYQASVRHQIRLSYEAQLSESLEKGEKLAEKSAQITKAIDENPFAALAYLGQMGPLAQEANELGKQRNNLAYALIKTYGQSAYDQWYKSEETRIERIQGQYNQATGQPAATPETNKDALTSANCDSIGKGSTLKNAEEKLGIKGKLSSSSNFMGTTSMSYTFASGSKSCTASFQNGVSESSMFMDMSN